VKARASNRPDRARTTRRPRALHRGDRVVVLAPASASGAARIRRGVHSLERLGFDVRVSPQAFARHHHFAGTDSRRAAALRAALLDPSVRAIFFTRGGFGAARLLPLVEGDFRRAEPKILVGYSDATSILAFAAGRLGWVTFHGPMIATDFALLHPADRASLLGVLGGLPPRPLRLAATIRRGTVEGKLFGGCLSILVSLLGTPYAANLADRIVFLEDVNEEPYQLDRMLTQLRQTGQLARARGIVFGEMANCGRRRDLLGVLTERTADLGIPVAFGLPSGHGRGKRTLPLGTRVRLDASGRTLELLERAVSA
jgi:muramoyltetrapeptide carboxypeptidase